MRAAQWNELALPIQPHQARVGDVRTEVGEVAPHRLKLCHRGSQHGRGDARASAAWVRADVNQPAKANGAAAVGDGPMVGRGKADSVLPIESEDIRERIRLATEAVVVLPFLLIRRRTAAGMRRLATPTKALVSCSNIARTQPDPSVN